jgi:hypothetical protein
VVPQTGRSPETFNSEGVMMGANWKRALKPDQTPHPTGAAWSLSEVQRLAGAPGG